jgi:NAD(P)H-hydrate repair Nnr-like enzyme with NAD(P)H-hydrate epimerase domain
MLEHYDFFSISAVKPMGRRYEFAQGGENGGDGLIVRCELLQARFELIEATGQLLVGDEELAQRRRQEQRISPRRNVLQIRPTICAATVGTEP